MLIGLAAIVVIALAMIGYMSGAIEPEKGAAKSTALAEATSNPEVAGTLFGSPTHTPTPVQPLGAIRVQLASSEGTVEIPNTDLVIDVALEPAVDGLVWVLVNPQ